MPPIPSRGGFLISLLAWSACLCAAPDTINIQGSLTDPGGGPLAGTRAFRVRFHDSPADGNPLGVAIEGFVTVSSTGRFSIDLVPPSEVFTAAEVYYSLGVDSDNPTDGQIDTEEEFPGRVKVNSVLFARMAEQAASADTATHATSADTAESATTALTLSGSLSNPGDQIPLGGGVVLQVAEDGTVEFLADGQRLRLASQRWFDPRSLREYISPEDGGETQTHYVAHNNNGEEIITWSQRIAFGLFRVLRAEYRGGSWKFPGSVNDSVSPNGSDGIAARVDINDNGEAVIVWHQSDGSKLQIFRSEYRNGLWADPPELSNNISPDGQDAERPQVALNDNGDAIIVWQQSDGSNVQIFRSEYRNGSWNDPSTLANNISPDGQDALYADVALNDNGDAIIAWQQSDGSHSQIFRSEYRNGFWSDPSSVANNISPDGQAAQFVRVALNEVGEAIIVWEQSDGGKIQIFRSEYRNGSWNDPATLANNISPDGQDARNARVALNDNGEAVIVWHQSDGANFQVFRSEYRNGAWNDPPSVANNISPNGQEASFPAVALNNEGEAVIVWHQSDGNWLAIFRSEYRDGSWTDPTTLKDNFSPVGENASIPYVALNDTGEKVIVWRQDEKIFFSEFRFGF